MPLVRLPDAFDHPDWLFKVKHDGFRALAYVEGHRCRLVSRRGHEFRKFTLLAEEIVHSVRTMSAILDGEIVCLGADGRNQFHPLLFRRDWPYFYAFDLLAVDGEDLRDRPLLERKRRLRAIMPRIPSRFLYVDHVRCRGEDLFRQPCARDLEGIVGKWARGPLRSRRRVDVVGEGQVADVSPMGWPARTLRSPPRSTTGTTDRLARAAASDPARGVERLK